MSLGSRKDADPSCVLITGGAGFIGSTLVRQWLAEESGSVVNLDAMTYAGLPESLAGVSDEPRHKLVVGRLGDGPLLRDLFEAHQFAGVIHLAAETHVDRSIAEPPRFVETNVMGTCSLLEAAAHYWSQLSSPAADRFRLVLVSTDEVFGAAAENERFNVSSPVRPNSPYAASKAASEQLAQAYAHTYGLPVIVVNPTNNYGPRQMPEKLIPKMILNAVSGQPLPLYGDGLHQRDWLHVDDCCRGLRAAMSRGVPGQRYLLGAGTSHPNRRIVEKLCDLVDQLHAEGPIESPRRDLIRLTADRPGHDRRYAVDATETYRQLSWSPQVDLADGLRETVQWYLSHQAWVEAAQKSLALRDFS